VSPKPPAGKVSVHTYNDQDVMRRVRHKAVDLGRSLSSCSDEAWLVWLDWQAQGEAWLEWVKTHPPQNEEEK